MNIDIIRREFKTLLSSLFTKDELLAISSKTEQHFNFDKLVEKYNIDTIQIVDFSEIVENYFFNNHLMIDFISSSIERALQKSLKDDERNLLNNFIALLEKEGCHYNVERKTIEKINSTDEKDFGLFFNNNKYYVCFLSIDICGSSKIVANYQSDKVHEVFDSFKNYIRDKVEKFNGRIWEWEGDGGTAAFYKNTSSGVLCSIDVLLNLVLFNVLISPIPENIVIRIAMHSGWITYKDKFLEMDFTEKVIADDIQKQATPHDSLVISDTVYTNIFNKLKDRFTKFKHNDMVLYKFDLKNLDTFKIIEEEIINS